MVTVCGSITFKHDKVIYKFKGLFLKPHLARASGYISLVDHLNSPTLKGLSTIKAAQGLHKGVQKLRKYV